jgi:4-amino-4-deoxy-L-arabinose transferase-like glycosyltransferase
MTFRLARRLWDRETAWRCVINLATLPGFVQVTHWLLVDNALAFFIVAALWALGEAYVGGRSRMLSRRARVRRRRVFVQGPDWPILVGLGGLACSSRGGWAPRGAAAGFWARMRRGWRCSWFCAGRG